MYSSPLTPEQAYQKARHFCAYQERCHQEVKDKLYGFGLRKTDVETLLSRLIEEDLLNEERFARQFAGGHFRLKKWGKQKIVHALRLKRVSEYNIRKALREIEDSDYQKLLAKLASAKWAALKNNQYIIRETKTRNYLLQKGFEPQMVQAALKSLRHEDPA